MNLYSLSFPPWLSPRRPARQVTGRSFMPLASSKKPDGNKWRKEPILQTRGSKFIKFQEARIQVGMHELSMGRACHVALDAGRAVVQAQDGAGEEGTAK